MSNQEIRLRRLEAIVDASDELILAVVPYGWDAEEAEAGIARLRRTHSLPEHWKVSVSRDGGLKAERLLFAGSMGGLVNYVARHSGRIGVGGQNSTLSHDVCAPKLERKR